MAQVGRPAPVGGISDLTFGAETLHSLATIGSLIGFIKTMLNEMSPNNIHKRIKEQNQGTVVNNDGASASW